MATYILNTLTSLASQIAALPEYSTAKLADGVAYSYTGTLPIGRRGTVFDGNRANGATLFSTDSKAVVAQVRDITVMNVDYDCPVVARGQNTTDAAIATNPNGPFLVTNFRAENNKIRNACSVGIMNFKSDGSRIVGNDIANVKADGIHFTGGSVNGEVWLNKVRDSGDDMIGIVSYSGSSPNANIYIHHNDLAHNLGGRGIGIIGGTDIEAAYNLIDDTLSAGILVARESPNSWNSLGVVRAKVHHNTLTRIQFLRNSGTGHAAIEIHAFVNTGEDREVFSVDGIFEANVFSNLGCARYKCDAGDGIVYAKFIA